MLILRRKAGEAIWIGDNIKVTILANDEGGVRLAVDAPKEITILREELLNAMRVNKDAAAEEAPPEALLGTVLALLAALPQLAARSEE